MSVFGFLSEEMIVSGGEGRLVWLYWGIAVLGFYSAADPA